MNDQTYYIIKGDQRQGPLYDTDILQWLNAGQISITDLVLRHSDNKWIPVAELFPAYVAQPPQKRPFRKNIWITGCLSIVIFAIIFCGCSFIGDAIFLMRCQGSGKSSAYCQGEIERQHQRRRLH